MERFTAVLSQDEYLPQTRMNTIAQGDIDEPESPSDGNRRFAPFFC